MFGMVSKISNSLSSSTGMVSRFTQDGKVQSAITILSDPDAAIPVAVQEVAVTAGRTRESYKRDGFLEARERFVEEATTAVIWLWGIEYMNKAINKLAKKLFGVNLSFDIITKNKASEPKGFFNNSATPLEKICEDRGKSIKNLHVGMKFAKNIFSAAAIIYFIGNVIPPINQKISEKVAANIKKTKLKNNIKNPELKKLYAEFITIKPICDEGCPDKKLTTTFEAARNYLKSPKQSKIGFSGGANPMDILTWISYTMENDAKARLLTTDTGIEAGRIGHSRNTGEKIEYAIRDITSIFFYMYSTPLIINGLRKLFDKALGMNTSLNPKTMSVLSQGIQDGANNELFKDKNSVTKAELQAWLLNTEKTSYKKLLADLNKQLRASDRLIQESNNHKYHKKLAEELFNLGKELYSASYRGEMVKLDNKIGQGEHFIDALNKAKIILSEEMGKEIDVFDIFGKSGFSGNPELLLKALSAEHHSQTVDPYKIISPEKAQDFIESAQRYMGRLLENKNLGEKITASDFEKALTSIKNKSILARTAYTVTGMVTSALFLSIIIPKATRLYTKWRTGEDKCPGIKGLKDED